MNQDIQEFEYTDGFPETSAALEIMGKEASSASIDPDIVNFARVVCTEYGANPLMPENLSDAIFWWIKKNIRYQKDPIVAEWIQSPKNTLQWLHGDCDCMATLFAAMALSVGVNCRFVVISETNLDEFHHVYTQTECLLKNGVPYWRSYDPATPGSFPGWEPNIYRVKLAYSPVSGEISHLSGFFSKVIKGIKDFFRKFERYVIRRPIKELKRFLKKQFATIYRPISKAFAHIRDEIRRFETKIAEEFARWETKFGPFGKIMVIGSKVIISFVVIPAALTATSAILQRVGLSQMSIADIPIGKLTVGIPEEIITATAQTTAQLSGPSKLVFNLPKSPIQLQPDEWELVLSLMGTATGITLVALKEAVAGTFIQLFQLAVSGGNLYEEMQKRSDALHELRMIKAKVYAEAQLQQEMILKLEKDVKILEKLVSVYAMGADQVEAKKVELQKELDRKDQERASRVAGNVQAYKNRLKGEILAYANNRFRTIKYLEKILANRKQLAGVA